MKGEHHGYNTLGDLTPITDFRGLDSIIWEDWLGVDTKPIVKGSFETPRFL
jgi:hypothetical protein